jgi:hypothetical protein
MFAAKRTRDYTAILAKFPGPVHLPDDRRKLVRHFIIGLAFVGAGLLILNDPRTATEKVRIVAFGIVLEEVLVARFSIAFLGLGVIISGVILAWPRSCGLTLDRDGFTRHIPLFQRARYNWRDCTEFYVVRGCGRPPYEGIEFDYARLTDDPRSQTMGRKVTLRANIGGLNPYDLATLMSSWRDSAMRGP